MNEMWLWRLVASVLYGACFFALLTLLHKYGGGDDDS